MRFSQLKHLLIYFPFKTLKSIIRLVNLFCWNWETGELCYNFSISNNLTQMVNFPTRIPDCGFFSSAILKLFLFPDSSICSTVALPPLGNSNHVVVLFSTDFSSKSKRHVLFITQLIAILVLTGMVFCIIWEMFHGSISSNSVILLLVLNFVSEW